ncbi:hypothetical protein [Rheinheimera aquimaris]|uniref:hypothetical protein n=1 Tax=Rheinheimera aquimaris TaxID=412437 RepID=UPI003A97CB04
MPKVVIKLLRWAGILLVLYGFLAWALGGYLPVGIFDREISSSGYYKVVAVESSCWYIAIPTALGFILIGLSAFFKNKSKRS